MAHIIIHLNCMIPSLNQHNSQNWQVLFDEIQKNNHIISIVSPYSINKTHYYLTTAIGLRGTKWNIASSSKTASICFGPYTPPQKVILVKADSDPIENEITPGYLILLKEKEDNFPYAIQQAIQQSERKNELAPRLPKPSIDLATQLKINELIRALKKEINSFWCFFPNDKLLKIRALEYIHRHANLGEDLKKVMQHINTNHRYTHIRTDSRVKALLEELLPQDQPPIKKKIQHYQYRIV